MKTFLAVEPWDLMGPDAASLLDGFSGELGATGVVVSMGLAPTIRLRSPGHDPRVVQTRGGLFFHAGDGGFEATRLKPIVSSSVPRRDWLAQTCESCAGRGLALRGGLSLSRLGRVAQKHRDMGCRNVFGATSREGVCLVNPDVQAFFAALLGVMSQRYAFDAITLTDVFFGWTEAATDLALTPLPRSSVEHAWLSVCFCESCLQRAGDAGVDALAAQRSVGAMVDSAFDRAAPVQCSIASVLADSAPLQAYVAWRGQALSAFWSRLTEACTCDLVIDVTGGCCAAVGGKGLNAITNAIAHDVRGTFGDVDYGAVAGVMSAGTCGTLLPGAEPDATPHAPAGECACDFYRSATANRYELRIPASLCSGDHGPQLVTTMAQAAETGVSAAQIDGAGSLSRTARDSVRQAIRFVRRRG